MTGRVTWTNPLEPQPQAAAGAPPLPNEPAPPPLPQEAPPLPEARFGGIPDIDPDLAYLLPQGAAVAGGSGAVRGQTATFNARTGKFQQPDNTYSLDHLAEWNRAKRQAGHYFDVESWEQSVKEENAKRKREQETGVSESQKITRKDMVSSLPVDRSSTGPGLNSTDSYHRNGSRRRRQSKSGRNRHGSAIRRVSHPRGRLVTCAERNLRRVKAHLEFQTERETRGRLPRNHTQAHANSSCCIHVGICIASSKPWIRAHTAVYPEMTTATSEVWSI